MMAESPAQYRNGIYLLFGRAPNGATIISASFVRCFAVNLTNGRCEPFDGEKRLTFEPQYYKGLTYRGKYRPSLLKRDIDAWPWRTYTDLVAQGVVRADKPVESLRVCLRCESTRNAFDQPIIVTGDRQVERGHSGLRISAAERFVEMPMRYDKAYGGTDEAAEIKLGDPEELRFYEVQVPEEQNLEMSPFSYPRNPAGKGYVVDQDSVVGLEWPNIEFLGDQLSLSNLVQPLEAWGNRPYPAGFDWFSHAWFPRVAFFGAYMPTIDNQVPLAEVQRGILSADLPKIPLLKRPKHGFAQGAHPFLARWRLMGDESIRINAMSSDGRDFHVQLPGLKPAVKLTAADCRGQTIDASLDLVFLETDPCIVTLVWRSTWMTQLAHLPVDWEANAMADIIWK